MRRKVISIGSSPSSNPGALICASDVQTRAERCRPRRIRTQRIVELVCGDSGDEGATHTLHTTDVPTGPIVIARSFEIGFPFTLTPPMLTITLPSLTLATWHANPGFMQIT